MEAKLMIVSVALTVLLATVSFALPAAPSVLEDNEMTADKRPKYMDTRDLDSILMASIRNLVEEGELNPAILPAGEDKVDDARAIMKRMQYMGICMKRRNNSFIPYPCLRTGLEVLLGPFRGPYVISITFMATDNVVY